ncbi:MAG: helix-turn-helix domain-containing protein [Thermoanaerobaculia bacterium]
MSRLPRLLSVRRVHEETDLPLSTVYDLVAKGDLPAIRNGRSVRIDERDLLRWIDSRRETVR